LDFDQSHPVFALSDTLVDELCALFPSEATYLGVAGHDDRWPDMSPEGAETAVARLRDMRRRIADLPPATNRWERIAVAAMESELDDQLMWYAQGGHLKHLNSISSPLQEFRETFDHMSREGVEAWENVAIRLEGLPAALDGYIAALDAGRAAGAVVPVRQVIEGARQAEVNAGDESFFLTLPREFADGDIDDEALAARIAAGADAARQAYGKLADWLRSTYAADAPEKDAAGPEEYPWRAGRMLGTDIDPIETYAWGWSEVASLRERMERVAKEIVPAGGIPESLEVLKTDPDRLAVTPDDLVDFLAARIDEALDRLAGSHFDVPEQIRTCDVKLAPPGGSLGAYYVGPSEDFTRPGSVWWSIDRSVPTPLYDNVSTAYHEGFPGHHLQVGIQVSLADRLSRMHRLWIWKSGSGEGWALYAERLMDELGYLDRPDYVFGYLSGQMLRACRVVIDIGSHLELPIPDDQPFHPGEAWTYETAVEMLVSYATVGRAIAESEVTRYLGWPGQAIAYKVGERQILALRDTARERLGGAFDERAFHARLLEVGPLGLDLVRRFVLED
jgi:uncharacterized protein (DUF885 family)